MKPKFRSLRSLILATSPLLMISTAHAVNQYWDTNGTDAGFGPVSGTDLGTWGTDAFWNTDSSGGAGTFVIDATVTDSRYYGNGSNGLGAGTITVSGTAESPVTSGNMTFDDNSGNITLSGGYIDVSRSSNNDFTINVSNSQVEISSNFMGTPYANSYGLAKSGSGMLVLSGDNSGYINGSYSRTTINAGVLKIDSANALPPGLVTFKNSSSGVLGLTAATGDFSRTVGYSPGSADRVQWGGSGGFAAYGGDRLVTLNGGGSVKWGVSNNGINGALVLGHSTADSKVTLNCGIDLNGGSAGVLTRVAEAGDGSAAIDGKISGVISDSGTTQATLQKTGAGTLELSNANTYTGATEVNAGKLTLGVTDCLADTSNVVIGAATLSIGAGFSDTVGTLDCTGAATINLGSGASLAFANSSGADWADSDPVGALDITGDFVSGSSIRFGTNAGGLSFGQLAVISVNGSGLGTYSLNSGGYLISAGGGSGFDTWKSNNPGAAGQTLADDHDNDGVENGVEYFLVGPNVDSTGFNALPPVVNTGGVLSVTWPKAASYTGTYGIHYVVETSTTLDSGSWAPAPGGSVTFPTNEVKFTFPAGTKGFARLKVTGP